MKKYTIVSFVSWRLRIFQLLIMTVLGIQNIAWAQTTPVNFDNPQPPGSSDSAIQGQFQGINFGTNQWNWTGPYAADPSNSIYFSSNVQSRTFTFSSSPQILQSVRAYTSAGSGTLNISDNLGQTKSQTISTGSMQFVQTGWTQSSTTVTVTFSGGWNLGLDDITYAISSPVPDTISPTVSISAPANGTTVSGITTISAAAADNIGVVAVQFLVDGQNLGSEVTSSPYSISWNTANFSVGNHTITATARDNAGNSTTSTPVSVSVTAPPIGIGSALRFFGNGINDIDRVKIRVDDPTNSNPGPAVDVGSADFTIEFWMKGNLSENAASAVSCGANNSWIYGNVVLDRDRYNQNRNFGLSIAGGRLVFGVYGATGGARTICGSSNIVDGTWHHVAVQRRRSDGWMWLYVDGSLQAQVNGPDGDISYPDNGVPGNFCGGPCTNSDPFLVIGAEKHDAGPQYPSYSGFFDELRISKVLRYSSTFSRPWAAFSKDANTVGLYHFDEGNGSTAADSSGASPGPSPATLRIGGNPQGPNWIFSGLPF